MAEHLRILLPKEAADELVAEGMAVRPLDTRGGLLNEPVTLAIEAVNTGSALVSIAVGVATCKRLAAAVLRRQESSDPDHLTISITVHGECRSLEVDRTAPDAEDKALDFFVAVLGTE